MKKKIAPATSKPRPIIRPQDALDNFNVKYGIPDFAKKKKKKQAKQLSAEGTLIYTDEAIDFSIQKPGLNNLTVKVEAYFAHVTVSSGALRLTAFPSSPVTSFFTVPSGSGYFDGDASVLLEDEWTTLTFELDGEVFEEEEQGNTLLLILIRGTEGTSPNQVVYEAGLIYSVVSPYTVSRKPLKKKAKAKKTKKS